MSDPHVKRKKLTIGVLLNKCNLLAEEFRAGIGVAASRLGVEGLAAVSTEVVSKGAERVVDVVGRAIGVSTAEGTWSICTHPKKKKKAKRTSCPSRGTCGHRRSSW